LKSEKLDLAPLARPKFQFDFSFDYVKLLEFLYDMNLLHDLSNQSILQLLDCPNQTEWYEDMFEGTWRSRIKSPYTPILTKWGYCFTFNMLPPSKLLHLDR
jgi:hypothetical protein